MNLAFQHGCSQCGFMAADANQLDGHVRNVHGWPTPPGVHTMPAKRCEYALPGLGRCVDCSGVVHGHHFKPGQLDRELVLSQFEAALIVDHLREHYATIHPVLSIMLDRLASHLRVTA